MQSFSIFIVLKFHSATIYIFMEGFEELWFRIWFLSNRHKMPMGLCCGAIRPYKRSEILHIYLSCLKIHSVFFQVILILCWLHLTTRQLCLRIAWTLRTADRPGATAITVTAQWLPTRIASMPACHVWNPYLSTRTATSRPLMPRPRPRYYLPRPLAAVGEVEARPRRKQDFLGITPSPSKQCCHCRLPYQSSHIM